MFVEDILLKITAVLQPGDDMLGGRWHDGFLASVGRHLGNNGTLSSAQGRVALDIIRKCGPVLVGLSMISANDLKGCLENPSYRRPPYRSTIIPREVRYLGGNFLGFHFKYHLELVERFNLFRDDALNHIARFDPEQKIWIVSIDCQTVDILSEIISTYRFAMDVVTRDYIALVRCSRDKPSTCALEPESQTIIVNVCDNHDFAYWLGQHGFSV